MRIQIVAVGRGGRDPGHALFEHYAGRITFPMELREIVVKRALAPREMKAEEGRLLLKAVADSGVVIALDEGGKNISSEKFAAHLGAWRDDGVKTLSFLIGGADGLTAEVKSRADLVLSLGAMTWPHMLVRGMLGEQIYRAQCILAGHPYHRA